MEQWFIILKWNQEKVDKSARSAGGYAQIMGREDKYVIMRLPSGEMRKILGVCMATIGVVGNEDFSTW